MDTPSSDTFANRDEPVPVLTVTNSDDAASLSLDVESEGNGRKIKNKLSLSNMKEKMRDINHAQDEKLEASTGSVSLQDRLFARILQQVVPLDEPEAAADAPVERRSSKYVRRPAFNLALMTNNFRKFNARVGIVFVFQNRLIRLFTWTRPSHTMAFLATYTFICLDPYLLIILPLAMVLLLVMVPAFLARHPPPPAASILSTVPYYSINGPALAPPKIIRPAAETSKDFFRNMRDLQNSMADFATIHDAVIAAVAPPTNFSNERLSSIVFLYLCVTIVLLFLVAHLLPWRFVVLFGGLAATSSGHPAIHPWLLETGSKLERWVEMMNDGSESASIPPNHRTKIRGIPLPGSSVTVKSAAEALSAILLDTVPQVREVEIFELQYRSSPWTLSQEWEAHLFTPTAYDPLSPTRISGDRPTGTRFFEDVQPPQGWNWQGKKWELDLEAREWVTERLVTGVGFEIPVEGDTTETEFGGWVWDLPVAKQVIDEDEPWLAYDNDPDARSDRDFKSKGVKRKDSKHTQNVQGRDWEESTSWTGRTGAWRRRRWVRLVRRISMDGRET